MAELVNLNFQLLLLCVFLCEHETALNFCGTSWVWVSIFVFHNLAFYLAGRIPVCTHHNHMMLKPIPNIMTTSSCISHLFFSRLCTSPFSFLFLSPSTFPSHQPCLDPSLHPPSHSLLSYSIISFSLTLNFQLYTEVSVQPQLPLFSVF